MTLNALAERPTSRHCEWCGGPITEFLVTGTTLANAWVIGLCTNNDCPSSAPPRYTPTTTDEEPLATD